MEIQGSRIPQKWKRKTKVEDSHFPISKLSINYIIQDGVALSEG